MRTLTMLFDTYEVGFANHTRRLENVHFRLYNLILYLIKPYTSLY